MFTSRVATIVLGVFLIGCMSFLSAAPTKDEKAVQKAVDALKSGSTKEKVAALKDLGRLGRTDASLTKANVPAIVAALDDKEPAVRAEAAHAIGLIDPADKKDVVGKLIKMLKEEKAENVREGAAMGLGAMGPEAREAAPALREADANAGKKGSRTFQNALMQITGKKKN